MQKIYHDSCPKIQDDEKRPVFEWGGFYMAGFADWVCPLCGDTLVLEDSDDE